MCSCLLRFHDDRQQIINQQQMQVQMANTQPRTVVVQQPQPVMMGGGMVRPYGGYGYGRAGMGVGGAMMAGAMMGAMPVTSSIAQLPFQCTVQYGQKMLLHVSSLPRCVFVFVYCRMDDGYGYGCYGGGWGDRDIDIDFD